MRIEWDLARKNADSKGSYKEFNGVFIDHRKFECSFFWGEFLGNLSKPILKRMEKFRYSLMG